MKLIELDSSLVSFSKKLSPFFTRFSIFVVYFWFGILKVLELSPATPLVHELFLKTVAFIPFELFLMMFGIFECLIGIMILIKGFERLAILATAIHLITTFMPLILIPSIWHGFLIPTMEAQYIIKNVLIIALLLNIGSRIKD